MITLSVTPLYAGLLGLLLVVLSVRVARTVRIRGQVSLGDDGNPEYRTIIRAQGNFIEYVPFAIVLIAIAEMTGTDPRWIHALGIVLVVARLLHPIGLSAEFKIAPLRVVGIAGTWLVLVAGSLLCLNAYFGTPI